MVSSCVYYTRVVHGRCGTDSSLSASACCIFAACRLRHAPPAVRLHAGAGHLAFAARRSSCRPARNSSDTEAVTDTIADRLRSRPEVESVFVDGGRIPPSVVEVRKAALTINYVPKAKRSLSQQQLEHAISKDLADIPDVRYWFLDENGQRNVKFIVTGQDSVTVGNVASELAAQMRRLPMVANVISGATLNRPELRIYPRRDLAVRLGVSTEGLSETIRVATIGDVGPALAKFDAGDRTVPIRVLLEENARADRQVLEQIRVPSQRGGGRAARCACRHQLRRGPHSASFATTASGRPRVEADLVDGAALSDAIKAVSDLSVMKNLPARRHGQRRRRCGASGGAVRGIQRGNA